MKNLKICENQKFNQNSDKKLKNLDIKINKITTKLESIKLSIKLNCQNQYRNEVAILIFNKKFDKIRAFHNLKIPCIFSCCLATCNCCQWFSRRPKLNKQLFRISDAPIPEDIIWEHLEFGSWSRCRRGVFFWFIFTIIFSVSISAMVGLTLA